MSKKKLLLVLAVVLGAIVAYKLLTNRCQESTLDIE
jgi:hypothetical protein